MQVSTNPSNQTTNSLNINEIIHVSTGNEDLSQRDFFEIGGETTTIGPSDNLK